MSTAQAFRLWPGSEEMIPRFIEAGDITLDLFHRDGRVDGQWVRLYPREFELLWRLAQNPGQRFTRQRLMADVWRTRVEPGTNSLAVHVARIRSKLEPFGLAHLLATHPDGGYLLKAPPGPSAFRFETAL